MGKRTKIWIGVGVVVIVLVAFFGGRMSKKSEIVVSEQRLIDSLRSSHKMDSIMWVYEFNEMDSMYQRILTTVEGKDELIARLKVKNKTELEPVKTLPANQTTQLFNIHTGDSSWVEVRKDTLVISPLKAIQCANVVMMEGNQRLRIIELLELKNEALDSALMNREEVLRLTMRRVVKLTDEYYMSQGVIDRQSEYIRHYKKKIKRRNVLIGVLGGVALASIVGIVIVN